MAPAGGHRPSGDEQDGGSVPGASVEDSPISRRGALEALLLVVDDPVDPITLAQIVERPTDEVLGLLAALQAEYEADRRGFELRETAGRWRLYTRLDYAPYVERLVLHGQQARLSRPALETLAVIAYRQPVSRGRIAAIRGVNVDGVVRTLVARGLVEECGSDPSGAVLYRTTSLFLERMGLGTLDDLPPIANLLPDLESIELDES